MVTGEKHFVDLLADTKRRYLIPLKGMDWVEAKDAKLLLEPFSTVLFAHQDFLRNLAQLLSKGWDSKSTGAPVAALMLEHAPAISAANIQFAAVVERIHSWFEDKSAAATPLVDFIAAQAGSVAEVQVTLDAPAIRVLEYAASLEELQAAEGYSASLAEFAAVPAARTVFGRTAAAVERIQGMHAGVEAAPAGLILAADVVTRGGNKCTVLLYPSTVVLMRRAVGGEMIGSWARTEVSACIEAAASAVRAAITTPSMITQGYSADQDLVTLRTKVGSTKLRFETPHAAKLWVRELYRPALLHTGQGFGNADGWSLFAAGKPLDEQAARVSSPAVVADAALKAAKGGGKGGASHGVVTSAAAASLQAEFQGSSIRDITTNASNLITEFTCITQYKV
eukprot:gene3423-25560_t